MDFSMPVFGLKTPAAHAVSTLSLLCILWCSTGAHAGLGSYLNGAGATDNEAQRETGEEVFYGHGIVLVVTSLADTWPAPC